MNLKIFSKGHKTHIIAYVHHLEFTLDTLYGKKIRPILGRIFQRFR